MPAAGVSAVSRTIRALLQKKAEGWQKEGGWIPFPPTAPGRSVFVTCNTRTVSGTEIQCHLGQGHLPPCCPITLGCLLPAGFAMQPNHLLSQSKSREIGKSKAQIKVQPELVSCTPKPAPGSWQFLFLVSENRGREHEIWRKTFPILQLRLLNSHLLQT